MVNIIGILASKQQNDGLGTQENQNINLFSTGFRETRIPAGMRGWFATIKYGESVENSNIFYANSSISTSKIRIFRFSRCASLRSIRVYPLVCFSFLFCACPPEFWVSLGIKMEISRWRPFWTKVCNFFHFWVERLWMLPVTKAFGGQQTTSTKLGPILI